MKLFLAAALALLSVASYAQTKIVSFDAFDYSYTGALSFKHEEGKHADRDTTTFKFNLNFAQNLDQYVGLMWKAQAYWNREDITFGSNDTLVSTFGGAGGRALVCPVCLVTRRGSKRSTQASALSFLYLFTLRYLRSLCLAMARALQSISARLWRGAVARPS